MPDFGGMWHPRRALGFHPNTLAPSDPALQIAQPSGSRACLFLAPRHCPQSSGEPGVAEGGQPRPLRVAPASVAVCRFPREQGLSRRVLSEPGAQSERKARGRASCGLPAHPPQLAFLHPAGLKPQDDPAPQRVLAAAPSDSAQNCPWPSAFPSTFSCLDQCSRHLMGHPALPSHPTAYSCPAPKSRKVPPLLRPLMALSSIKATVHKMAS